MTNWGTAFLPAAAMPGPFDVEACLGAGGIFRTDLSRNDFADIFSCISLEITTNMKQRFVHFLDLVKSGAADL